MGLLDGLFGRKKGPEKQQGPARFGSEPMGSLGPGYGQGSHHQGQISDEEALHRYNHLIRNARPQQIEQAHEEAFSKMTPEQRAQVQQALNNELTPFERMSANTSQNDPKSLAQLATRIETRNPGTMQRIFGSASYGGHGHGMRGGMGMGMGGMMAGLLGAVVLGVITSMIAAEIFEEIGEAFAPEEALAEATEDPMGYAEESFSDYGGDFGGGDFGGGDFEM